MPRRDLKKGERAYFLRSGGWPDLLMFTAVEREKPRKGGFGGGGSVFKTLENQRTNVAFEERGRKSRSRWMMGS